VALSLDIDCHVLHQPGRAEAAEVVATFGPLMGTTAAAS
jgi:hypothetical protein